MSSNSNTLGTSSQGERPKRVVDIGNLTPDQLRREYPTTYSTWRNMKARRHRGMQISPEFDTFAGFLREVGPRPDEGFTLDRIDFENPLYGPGLVRWLDKRGQANNRSSTIHLTDADGTSRPLSEWARITVQNPDTLRNRKSRGWSDTEVIRGRRKPNTAISNIWTTKPWDNLRPENQAKWENLYQRSARFDEYRIMFYIRTLECVRIDAIDEDESLQHQTDDASQERRAYLRRAAEVYLSSRRYADNLRKKMSKDVQTYKLKKPEGWHGPDRFKQSPGRR